MNFLWYLWLCVQILIGYNLVLPVCIYLLWLLTPKRDFKRSLDNNRESDYAIIVTAYKQTQSLPSVVDSILKLNYQNYIVYIVADGCDVSDLVFADDRIVVLRPELILANNLKSHQYAVDRFLRKHDCITIIDSDNLLRADYLNEINVFFENGFVAVQGTRKAKNTDTTISSLDAIRDVYYHFYDGKVLFGVGSSATLAGSGMAFERKLYEDFLNTNSVDGAGFDKVLQFWLLKNSYRIAFSEKAVVFDEKTSKSDQLVQQRSRWINTWFKYVVFGIKLSYLGLRNFSKNQTLFGIVLLRPPLFIFILLSGLFTLINLFISLQGFIIWLFAFLLFVLGFALSIAHSTTDINIARSLFGIPKFIYLQLVSLVKSKNANKTSVATTHYKNKNIDDL